MSPHPPGSLGQKKHPTNPFTGSSDSRLLCLYVLACTTMELILSYWVTEYENQGPELARHSSGVSPACFFGRLCRMCWQSFSKLTSCAKPDALASQPLKFYCLASQINSYVVVGPMLFLILNDGMYLRTDLWGGHCKDILCCCGMRGNLSQRCWASSCPPGHQRTLEPFWA